jgi:hypothetical protein
VVARAQQPERMQRISLLTQFDQNDPSVKARISAFTQALRIWVGPMAATCGWTFGGMATTAIGNERSRRSWSNGQLGLAYRYLNGWGVSRDYAEAEPGKPL